LRDLHEDLSSDESKHTDTYDYDSDSDLEYEDEESNDEVDRPVSEAKQASEDDPKFNQGTRFTLQSPVRWMNWHHIVRDIGK
jgi:hypothetical protein